MLIDTPVKEDEVKTHKKTSTAETQVFVYINHFAADRENLIIHFNVKKEIRVQKVNDYIIVYLLIGIAFVLLEVYFVKNKRMNKWILPSIILIASIALSIPFSVTFDASLILFQVVVLMGLYIEDLINHNQNRESDKMKLKIYNSRNFIVP
ncbi:hypothetical protein [Salinicoccus halodurans]|uniref:Uncharacterized protein n=1 Tax=Salinicoccus halodurans TaxID=407035 RepID=A0A0F7HJ94_9STAP|nr:hypothetical protein [Salinicoccus halodurans]AKG72807.1 hypothetical protein AAT16_00365 [Salinicoccus halodurans]SFK74435.1 hypothetical protein SAMN05216235_1437 [Salinicoccus halodurans]